MLRFHYSVRLRVVARDPNVPNAILFSEQIYSGDVRSGVIGDYIRQDLPSGRGYLEYEGGERLLGVRGSGTSFGPRTHGATSMEDVAIVPNPRHQESIQWSFSVERRDRHDDGRDVEEDFVCRTWHSWHVWTYQRTSLASSGHQNRTRRDWESTLRYLYDQGYHGRS